jgi:hypothetical protein
MNELDTLIRQQLLRWPGMVETRWDVLRHLYLVIGNGFDWVDGRLVEYDIDSYDEDVARAEFFADIEEKEGHLANTMTGRRLRNNLNAEVALLRAQRQVRLDHLDTIAVMGHSYRPEQIGYADVRSMISPRYSKAFTVPEGAEESFRRGASEALRTVNAALWAFEGQWKEVELRNAVLGQIKKLNQP